MVCGENSVCAGYVFASRNVRIGRPADLMDASVVQSDGPRRNDLLAFLAGCDVFALLGRQVWFLGEKGVSKKSYNRT